MDINRSRLSILSLFMITICFWFFPLSIHAASRGITVISDLSHQSGKLGAYRALIIGINDYKDPKIPDLETAVKDAQAMANLLRDRYDFKVELLLDRKATKASIFRTIRKLVSSSKPDDSVLIYYAGHGDLDRLTNEGWWIPEDAKGGDPVTYLDNSLIQTYIRSMKARHVLLISDSCYSGTLFGQARAMPPVIDEKYYLNLYNEKSRWGMTSGNRTPVSDSGSGGHSVFAYQLLKELRNSEKPYISTQELYTRIAPIISNNSEQTPICRPIRNTGDQGGEFVFLASSGVKTNITVNTDVDTGLDVERKRLEAEKKKLLEKEISKYASINPEVLRPKVIKREGHFIAYDNGTVKDTNTGLMWASKDNGEDINWKDAKRYCENYRGGGYTDWRMPTQDELEGLYDKSESYQATQNDYNVHLTKLIELSNCCPWASETRGSDAARFSFGNGSRSWIHQSSFFFISRALPVRSSTGSDSKVSARDGTFVAYDNGVVYDKNTRLEWYAGPDRDTDWNEAKRWVENLTIAGGGWRMPTRQELKTLYQKGAGTRSMTPLLKTTGWWVWGEARDSSSAWGISFYWGNEYWYDRDNSNGHFRGFAVRSKK